MNDQAGYAAIAVMVIAVLGIGSLFWRFSRSKSILEKWAEQNGYEILESDYRMLAKGPFFWRSSEEQAVYHVKVRDGQGQIRTGWIRCGGWVLGLLSDKVEVKWEE